MNEKIGSAHGQLLPVLIDLSEKQVVLLAEGGEDDELFSILHALRPCTDHLCVLTPSASGPLRKRTEDLCIDLKEKPYCREDLYGADVVICASPSRERKDEVHAACRTLGIRLSILSEPERSDFILIQESQASAAAGRPEGVSAPRLPEKAPRSDPAAEGLSAAFHKVTIYTDGASRGNPGPGGYGAVIEYVDPKGTLHTKELSQGYEKTTNNRMELMGAIAALEALTMPCEITLWSDSTYLVSAFNDHWIDNWIRKKWMHTKNEPVKNADLWKRLISAAAPHHISWNWVKGHNGHPQNERCDTLATSAADSGHLLPDPGARIQE